MALKKRTFSDLKEKFSKKANFKPERFFDLGEAFLDATGLPGPAMGHLQMFLGHSDTGKTTALIKAAVDAQHKGVLPVLIITEQKWGFEHAKLLGFDCEEVVDKTTGELEYDLLFLWDSVGSVPCKMTFDGKGGKMHNAATLADKIGMGLNQRIGKSRRQDSKYTNTLVVVNQPWVELPDNPFGQPKIKAKGGESLWLNSTLVFRFGNQKNAGTTNISAVKEKRKVKFATRTKITIMKNHVNGLGYEDGKILITPHGFIAGREPNEEKKSIENYKQENSTFWSEQLGVGGDFDLKIEKEND